jgi:hypothetical protein
MRPRMIADGGEDVGVPDARLDGFELDGLDARKDDGGAMPAAVLAAERPVAAPTATPRKAGSATSLVMQTRLSSRKREEEGHRFGV